MNVEIIPEIDRGSVARPGAPIPAIVRPYHPHTCVVIISHERAFRRPLPWMITEPDALALSAAVQISSNTPGSDSTNTFGAAARERETEPRAVRRSIA